MAIAPPTTPAPASTLPAVAPAKALVPLLPRAVIKFFPPPTTFPKIFFPPEIILDPAPLGKIFFRDETIFNPAAKIFIIPSTPSNLFIIVFKWALTLS